MGYKTNKKATRKMPRIILEDAQHLIAGDAIIWGKVPQYKRMAEGWIISQMRDQWIARFMRHPNGTESIWFYTDNEETAKNLVWEAVYKHRRDLAKRIEACTSWGFGLQEDWMKEPALFLDPDGFNPKRDKTIKPWPWIKPYDYEDQDGNESDKRGPYGMTFEEPEPSGTYIWLQGRRVLVDEVSDMQIDTTLDETALSYVEKVAMLNERKAWREAYLSGEFDNYAE
jgi:hypothetical protein